jgi:GNAT superfamily N-acetyltransferase
MGARVRFIPPAPGAPAAPGDPAVPPGRTHLGTVVTYLEMTAPPAGPPVPAPMALVEIRRVPRPRVVFYRQLYEAVGTPWMWTERRCLGDDALAAILDDPRVEVDLLRVAGVPAGYVELDRRAPPDTELAYLGLTPAFIGLGLGRHLLDWAIRRAWRAGPRRLWVHTCDLDHPGALATYRRAGFRVFDRRHEGVPVVPGVPLPEHRRQPPRSGVAARRAAGAADPRR